jgi:formamidase
MAQYLTPMGPSKLHVIGPLEPRFSEWLVFEGVSVDETGKQRFLDAWRTSGRCSTASSTQTKFGYTKA